MGLILGLALGLGIPFTAAVHSGAVFYVKKSTRFTKKNKVDIEMTSTRKINERTTSDEDAVF